MVGGGGGGRVGDKKCLLIETLFSICLMVVVGFCCWVLLLGFVVGFCCSCCCLSIVCF